MRGCLSLLAALAVACDDGNGGGRVDSGTGAVVPDAGTGQDGGTGTPDGGQGPPGATTAVPVSVPGSMRDPPFDVARTLTVPQGFSITVHARVPGARFM